MSSWFYVDGGQNRQGPVSAEALLEAYRMGVVGNQSLVWREGLAEWAPLHTFSDELGLAAVTPVAPPPPAAARVEEAVPAKKGNGCLIAGIVIVVGGVFLLMVLGILAAIALPAYQDYVNRSKLASIQLEGRAATTAVEQFKANTDRCPRDGEELGLSPPTMAGIDALEVGSLEDGRCAVEITVGMLGSNASALGGHPLLTQEADGTWTCSADGIPEKMLPSQCR